MFLKTAQVTINLHLKAVLHELCLGKCWKLIAIFNLIKIRMGIDIFGNEKCKVTFGLKYIAVVKIKVFNTPSIFDTPLFVKSRTSSEMR